jgi:hypothetical protein
MLRDTGKIIAQRIFGHQDHDTDLLRKPEYWDL